MAVQKRDGRKPHPWEYPHSFDDDPEAKAERRELDHERGSPSGGSSGTLERAVTAYWQRHGDHADAWLRANPEADQRQRDRAFAYRVAAARNARTAGGLKPSPLIRPDLERLFRETGNPLYVWQAVAWEASVPEMPGCSGGSAGPATVPGWCARELVALARRLTILGHPGTPAGTDANVKRALGLTSQGFNAYGERDRRRRDQERADFVAELVAAGLPEQRARAVAHPHITDPRALRRAGKRVAPRAKPPPEA